MKCVFRQGPKAQRSFSNKGPCHEVHFQSRALPLTAFSDKGPCQKSVFKQVRCYEVCYQIKAHVVKWIFAMKVYAVICVFRQGPCQKVHFSSYRPCHK